MPYMSDAMAKVNPKIFHDHLDACEQCREHPFELCPVGEKKLLEACRVEGTISGRIPRVPTFHICLPTHDEVMLDTPNLNGDSLPDIDYSELELRALAHIDKDSYLQDLLKRLLPPEEK